MPDLLEVLGLRAPARSPSQVLDAVNSALLKPKGLVELGNIDLGNRPVVRNSDGTISTVRSMSFNDGKHEVLVPTIGDDGKVLSEDEAIGLYQRTGRHLGKFESPEHATDYAQRLHEEQARRYAPVFPPPGMQGVRG